MTTIISGTHRRPSLSIVLARWLEQSVQAHDHPTHLIDLAELPQQFLFNEMFGQRTAEFQRVEDTLRAAQRVVFVVPEYNGSFPGALKLFIDAFERSVLGGKKAALVGLSSGKFGNVRGLDHLSGVLNYLQAEVMPFRAHLPRVDGYLTAEHGIADPAALKELNTFVERLLKF
jgi:chromate reductase, NAD(P)H dehydrogenase (quinone)